ncbi:MAG: sodium-dependent transporter [Candidatus Micrarchaeota archaeon]
MADAWSSKTAFVLASIGAAVGLGNIWRFPYIASENGGLWFIIPYLVCLLIVGIPLFLLETGQGIILGRGFFKAIEQSPNLPFIKKPVRRLFGTFPVLVSTVILGYYTALCSWTLWFAVQFILGNGPSFSAMQQSYTSVIAFIVVFATAYWVVKRGISKGIEPITRYLVPTLFAFLLVLFIYSLTLPDAGSHLEMKLSGGFDKLFEPRTWYYALSQVLFSLSVGYGIMFTYGTYLKNGKGVFASAFQVAGADTAASLLAFISIVIIGATVNSPDSGLALSFEILPAFFASQGISGILIGAVFFGLLFGAAFTSVISMLEHTAVSTSFLKKRWRLSIEAAVFALGLLSVLSYTPLRLGAFGKPILDLLDFVFGTILAPFSALVIVISCAYLLPHQHLAGKIGVPERYRWLFVLAIRKVIPIAFLLLIIFSEMAGLY